MTESWPTPEEVVAALRSSGHLLEQEVASELELLGMNVATNRAYQDVDEGKSREIDVWANYTAREDREAKVSVYAQLLVECKATAAPFAILTRPLSRFHAGHPPEEVVFPVPRFTVIQERTQGGGETWSVVPAFFFLGLEERYWGWTEQRGVSIIRMDRQKGSWRADNTGVFDSLVYPLAKALKAFRAPFVTNRTPSQPGDSKVFVLFVPMVVVASRLFVVDGTVADPAAQEVGHVRLQRELKTGDLNGVYGIDFVQREHLARFVTEKVMSFADELAALSLKRPDLATSNTPSE